MIPSDVDRYSSVFHYTFGDHAGHVGHFEPLHQNAGGPGVCCVSNMGGDIG